jgi:hypothetical protein
MPTLTRTLFLALLVSAPAYAADCNRPESVDEYRACAAMADVIRADEQAKIDKLIAGGAFYDGAIPLCSAPYRMTKANGCQR